MFYCMFFVPYVSMDRPVEKMHVNELKELLRSNNVSLKGLTVKAQLVAKYVGKTVCVFEKKFRATYVCYILSVYLTKTFR